jgi:hypothetical protein
MSTEQELKQIQNMVNQGTITDAEAQVLRDALEGLAPDPELKSSLEDINKAEEGTKPFGDFTDNHSYWLIPTSIGSAIILLGSGLMYWAWSTRGFGFLFILSWLPFLFGLAVLILGWRSRTGPWLQINIEQPPGEKPEKIRLRIPLPLRFTGWILGTVSRWIPDDSLLKEENLIKPLNESISQQHPIEILINDPETGERVQLVIG